MKLPFFCFIHIERSGGITLGNHLLKSFPGYLSLRPYPEYNYEFSKEALSLLKKGFPNLQGIGGHTTRAYLDYEEVVQGPVFYFTFLRDPVKRYMSHLNYQIARMNKEWKLDEFLADESLSNYQVKRIAGSENLALAQKIIEEKIDFVGLTERFDESLVLLKSALGGHLQVDNSQRNAVTKDEVRFQFDLISAIQQEQIRDQNKLDQKLYNFALNEVFPRQLEKYKLLRPAQETTTRFEYRQKLVPGKLARKLKNMYVYSVLQPLVHYIRPR